MPTAKNLFLLLCLPLLGLLLWTAWARLSPGVVATTPADGEEAVSTDADLAIRFSQPMASATVDRETVELRMADGSVVPAAVSYDSRHRIARIVPEGSLRPDTTYEFRVGAGPHIRPSSMLGLPTGSSVVARFRTKAPALRQAPPNAPILIVADERDPFAAYYEEILLAEGMNVFSTADLAHVTPARLSSTEVVILTAPEVSDEKLALFEDWIRTGGNLIAIRPAGKLLPLLGIAAAGEPLEDGRMLVDPASEAGRGIVGQTLQLHVPSSRYTIDDGGSIARLYTTADSPLPNPAVTLRQIGQGQAAAYAYDLAQSVVLTRQGNPAWIDQDRDGLPPRRTNDLFYPDYVDNAKVGIPQADEQQRFFANLIVTMTSDRRPLPRFWYLPAGRRAAILMASDDHATQHGTLDSFERLSAASPPGCRLAAWECFRATSYVTVGTPITPGAIRHFMALGFEVGVHTDTGCRNQDNAVVGLALSEQIEEFGRQRLGIPHQQTHRIHCVTWNGWADTAKSERNHGIRLSLDFYYWPGSWVQGRPGFMTGSGFPMRFADLDGSILDIYQAASHIVNENGIDHATALRVMIDKALGPEQFFGIFGTHYDFTDDFLDTALAAAKERGVALISAEQALRWIDGRNRSRFDRIAWNENALAFEVRLAPGADMADAMLPLRSSGRRVTSVACNDEPKAFQVETVKGLEYALFPVESGACRAIYGNGESYSAQPSAGFRKRRIRPSAADGGTRASTGSLVTTHGASIGDGQVPPGRDGR